MFANPCGAAPPLIERAEWIAKHLASLGPGIIAAADRHSEIVEEAGGSATVIKPQGLITDVFEQSSWTLSPMSQAPFGEGMVTFNLTYLKTRSAFADATVRRERYDRLVGTVRPLSTDKLGGYPAFAAQELNEADVTRGLTAFLRELAAMVR